eukprot:gene2076-2353_t
MGGNLMKKNNLFQFGPKKPDFKKEGKKELQRKRRIEGVTDEEAMAFGEITEEEMEASEPDEVPSELITALGEFGITEVTKLLNTIYDTATPPDDLKKSLYSALLKKPGMVKCDQHRTISLMSHLTKVLPRVTMCRMRDKILPEISETQFGFMADKGTINAIFALRMLMEIAVEV